MNGSTLTALRRVAAAFLISLGGTASAGVADVVDVAISHLGDGSYRIDVTLEHADTGWDHYADRWDVLDAEGNLLGSRELLHPHVNEQPFTRSLTLNIPDHVQSVTVQGHDSVHGLGGRTQDVVVPR